MLIQNYIYDNKINNIWMKRLTPLFFNICKMYFLILFISTQTPAAQPTAKIYVEISGHSRIAGLLMEKFSEELCYQLGIKGSEFANQDCHIFIPFSKKSDLKEKKTYLYKIKIEKFSRSSQSIFSIEGYKWKDKKLEPYFNAGQFKIPSDYQVGNGDKEFSDVRFVKQMKETILKLSYK